MSVLYENIEDFLESDTYRGDRRPTKTRPYDQWLYLAAYHAFSLEEVKDRPMFKVGFTGNILRRNKELEKGKEETSFTASIVYAWPIPSAKNFETEVKRYFKKFTHEDAFSYMGLQMRKIEAKDEIIWGLKLLTLVKLIRLIILKY